MSNQVHKYITFKLGSEEYGIATLKVCDLIGAQRVTRVQLAPNFLSGVVRWNGSAVPILDLRAKLGMSALAAGSAGEAVIIIVELSSLSGSMTAGILVHELFDVCVMRDGVVAPFRALPGSAQAPLVCGVGMLESRVIFLLDIDQVLDSAERAVCIDLAQKAFPPFELRAPVPRNRLV